MKAMILAAGRGERMRPLSDSIPKPLLLINGEMLIERHLRRLAKINIRDVVINVSYLAEKIQTALGDGSQYGITIHYSYEAQPLEAAGGIIHALPLLGNDPFIMISADIVVDYPLEQLRLAAPAYLGHLVCVENPSWHTEGDFGIDQAFIIPKAESTKTYTYANVGIISPQLVAGYAPGKRKIGALFERAAQQQQLTGEVYTGAWHNIGTMALYEEAKHMMLTQKDSSREVAR